MDIKERVKDICKDAGISMETLSDRLGITRVTLTRNLSGNPTLETLEKIAKALNVDIIDLFEKKQDIKVIIEYQGDRKTLTEKDLIELFKKK